MSRLPMARLMLINILARNQDDHTNHIVFLMDRAGAWSLAPAYGIMYSYPCVRSNFWPCSGPNAFAAHA
jgi:serine/threonine protein kinase HipA of HipAB toxin-antitoxin module